MHLSAASIALGLGFLASGVLTAPVSDTSKPKELNSANADLRPFTYIIVAPKTGNDTKVDKRDLAVSKLNAADPDLNPLIYGILTAKDGDTIKVEKRDDGDVDAIILIQVVKGVADAEGKPSASAYSKDVEAADPKEVLGE